MKTDQYLEVSTTDADCIALRKQADRIAGLLDRPSIQSDNAAMSTLDFFAGAVNALFLARHHNYSDRTDREPSTSAIQEIAQMLSQGQVRTEGAWLAGFHFNSGLARLAAVFERSMKIATGKREKREKHQVVLKAAKKAFKGWAGASWNCKNAYRVYAEVNQLKHGSEGLWKRNVEFKDALAATDELLTLLEAWRDAGCPK